MAEIKSKYEIFCNELESMLKYFEKNQTISNKSISEDDLVTYKFISQILVKVEAVRTDNSKLVNFYFPIAKKCYYLSDDTKRKFLKDVDRESLDSKLSGLYSEKMYFNQEMDFNQSRFNNRKGIFTIFGSGTFLFLEVTCFVLTITNNLMLLMDDESMIELFGLIELALSVVAIVFFLNLNYPLVRQLNRFRYETTAAVESYYNKIQLDVFQSFLYQKNVWVFLYHIFCVSAGLYGYTAIITLDVFSAINLFDTMQFIIRSVVMHIGQLLSTLALAGLIMFSFSYLVTMYFVDEISGDTCSSFSSCFFYIMDQAFSNGQGIAGLTSATVESLRNKYYLLFLLNITFFLLINTVLLNIILAILVDTFSALRQKSDQFGNK